VNLRIRRVIPADGNQVCAFCDNCSESSLHLLLYCDFAISVWRGVFDWLGLRLQFPHNFTSLFNFALAVPGSKQTKRAVVMIWGAVLWLCLRMRDLQQRWLLTKSKRIRGGGGLVVLMGNHVYCTSGCRSQLFVWRCVCSSGDLLFCGEESGYRCCFWLMLFPWFFLFPLSGCWRGFVP
jgi:hypothetical protein